VVTALCWQYSVIKLLMWVSIWRKEVKYKLQHMEMEAVRILFSNWHLVFDAYLKF
jgi:hypothetical protein